LKVSCSATKAERLEPSDLALRIQLIQLNITTSF